MVYEVNAPYLIHLMVFVILVIQCPFFVTEAGSRTTTTIYSSSLSNNGNRSYFVDVKNTSMIEHINDLSNISQSSPMIFDNVQVVLLNQEHSMQNYNIHQDDELLSGRQFLRIMLPPRDLDQTLCGTNLSYNQSYDYKIKEIYEPINYSFVDQTAIALLLINLIDKNDDFTLRERLNNSKILNSHLRNTSLIIRYLIIPSPTTSITYTLLEMNEYTTNVTIIYMQANDIYELKSIMEQKRKSDQDCDPYLLEEGNDNWNFDFFLIGVKSKEIDKIDSNSVGLIIVLIQILFFAAILICCARAHLNYHALQEFQNNQDQQRVTTATGRVARELLVQNNKNNNMFFLTPEEFDQLPTIKYQQALDLSIFASQKCSSKATRPVHELSSNDIESLTDSRGNESDSDNIIRNQRCDECELGATNKRNDGDETESDNCVTEETLQSSTKLSCEEPSGLANPSFPPIMLQEATKNNKRKYVICNITTSTDIDTLSLCRDKTCSICIDDFIIDEDIIILPRCKHIYHKNCIRQWLLDKQGYCCPLCKTPVLCQ